ncbi:hypothetical protein C7974DRAFT_387930 [Boeremia exigua]|uniref:uncharacterized protein n=1 Tax=Boeremia exigua TaxID=749465 RepID=UPI001E8E58B9|nr:uncharacterized protein C7974DRAFT_387930 [Boeremia exigua]KAH6639142.1 hypothetical protein C7974DRAFT_387930 [Boeremia exigua]
MHDYQIQIMLLEQQHKKRILMARRMQDNISQPHYPKLPVACNVQGPKHLNHFPTQLESQNTQQSAASSTFRPISGPIVMHHALYVREIVAAILEEVEPSMLYNCLLVNKMFYEEALRVLWKVSRGELASMQIYPECGGPSKWARRGLTQFHANFIHDLTLEGEPDTWSEEAEQLPMHRLQFPSLKKLVFRQLGAKWLYTERDILNFVHTGLKALIIISDSFLTDHFLEEVSRLCPGLRRLHISSYKAKISWQALAHFLPRMPYLEFIYVVRPGIQWSLKPLAAGARCEQLKHAYVYNHDLPKLQNVLRIAAQFSRLTGFHYEPREDALILGADLRELADRCPQLMELSIDEPSEPMQAFGINDELLHHLTKSLPHLQEVTLNCLGEALSLTSVMSAFGQQHCPSLRELQISCSGDWNWLSSTGFTWLYLLRSEKLHLQPYVDLESRLSEEEFQQLSGYWEERARRWFPQIKHFVISDEEP